MSAYGDFAEIYDLLMDDFDAPAWANYYLQLIARAGVQPRTMCDCACGTGALTIPFSRHGIRVTGVDLSEEMLEQAARKAREAGSAQIVFVHQDMCRLNLPRPVDALVCGCDGVNYLLTQERLRAFFSAVHRAIRPGGVLAFDISSGYKLEKVLGDGFFGEERDEVAYLWSNQYDPERRTVTMDLTFFRKEASGLYRRFSERHVQRAHRIDELAALLKQVGFSQICVYGDRTWDAPREDELRIHFSCVRE